MTSGTAAKGSHAALVAGQIALTLLLLAAAGAAAADFLHLAHTNLGYDPHNVMAVDIPLHGNSFNSWDARAAYFIRLQQKVAAVPGVLSTAIATNAVPPYNGADLDFEIFGAPAVGRQRMRLSLISPEYFSLLRIPLLRGRLWDAAENRRGAAVAVVNQTLARQYWPSGDAVGRQIRSSELKIPGLPEVSDADAWTQVIGVVGDSLNDGLRNPVKPTVYLPFTRVLPAEAQILVHTRVAPLSQLPAVRAAIELVNSDQEVGRDVRDLEELITRRPEWAQQSLISALVGSFSFIALSLAIVGLYSVVSYSVAERTNEFGVRIALGAQRDDVLGLVLSSAAASVGSGLLAGTLMTLALSRITAHWVHSAAHNLVALVGAACAVLAFSFLASYIPARRAAKVDPMVALRYE